MLDLWIDHDPQRGVLQVRELRQYQRLRLTARPAACPSGGPCGRACERWSPLVVEAHRH